MATNPFKQSPPTTSTSANNNSNVDHDEQLSLRLSSTPAASSGSGNACTPDSSSILKQRATCACSNISIMQLFHEMKQKYPTVPDTVVSELVTQNCHDRPACIGKLEEAVLGTPAQTTYPAQSIHSGSLKRRTAEQRKLAAGSSRLQAPEGNGFSNGSSSNSSTSSREGSVDSSRLRAGACDVSQFPANVPQAGGGHCDRPSADGRVSAIAHRPTTLGFASPGVAMGYGGGGGGAPPLPLRPNRTAPTCPPTAALGASTITTTTTASRSADLGETVNLQVNVTVSPKPGGPLHVGQRHTSTISLQPEPPYTRELAQVCSTFNSGPPPRVGAGSAAGTSQGHLSGVSVGGGNVNTGGGGGAGRSSTSVNLTLRQPTDGRPHSPINIHASPLKYTAKNFNAFSGIQSKLEVTFREGFGSFSAMRAHVPKYEPYQGMTHQQKHSTLDAQALPSASQYQAESMLEQRDGYRYQPPAAAAVAVPSTPSRFPPPLSSSSPLSSVHQMQTHRGLMGPLRGGSVFPAGQLENDGLTKEMRYQNFVVAEMAVSQQLEQKQRLSSEIERKQMQFESICRQIFVLQQPLQYIDAELLEREVLLLAAEVEQLQKEVDSCDDEEARAVAAAAAGSSITDGLNALSVEGGSPMLPGAGSVVVVNRPPRPPRPPPPRGAPQSSSRNSSGSITPCTPLLSGVPFGGVSSGAASSSSSSSPCSTVSTFTSNCGGGSGDSSPSRPNQTHSNSAVGGGDQATTTGLNQPWTCTLCTFQNHELMTSCELCSLPKASGSSMLPKNMQRSSTALGTTSNTAFGTDVCDRGAVAGGEIPVAVALLRRQHLSVDTGVAAAAAAAAAAATAAVVGTSVSPSTAPPYTGVGETPPPTFASLSSSFSSSMPLQTSASQSPLQPGQPPQMQQQQPSQQQQQQPNPPPLQNAQYQKSSIEC